MALKKPELYFSLWQSCDELRGCMDVELAALEQRPATPAGVGCSRSVDRWYRFARPPANGLHPSGMARPEPGGFTAISRWLRRSAPIPPDHRPKTHRIPEGCQT